jgi:TetR/AcrR family transcriptional regulator, transcriptional repressor of bet genes
MPRPSNSAERRLQIARALRQVMAHKGYDGASIADVAAAAGLAPGLVHYHFKSKLDILVAVVDDLFEGHLAALDREIASAGDDAARKLAAFLDMHLATGHSADPDSIACWIAIIGEALREARVREAHERATSALLERLRAIVRDGVSAGVFHASDPRAAAAALLASIEGYMVMAATARSQIPRGTAAASVRAMARGLLQTERPLPPRKRRA